MVEITKESKKKEEKSTKTLVVRELPTQAMNTVTDDKGNDYSLMTVEEALTEILEIVKSLKAGVL